MSALRDRLRGALSQPLRGEPAVRNDSVTESLDLSILGGNWFQGPHGPGYVVESVYEGGFTHGNLPLHRALDADMAHLARQSKDPRLAETSPASLLFIDTETTGLGGSGSMVFMCGVARFEGATLKLRQYLLPGPAYEGGLLGGVAEELEGSGALVSYNGKSFDVPALEARAILSRTTLPLRTRPHLDLLHPNRRLFKGMFQSHRLPEMEVQLLGFERQDDAPGSEAPERYFRFQRTSDPTHIAPVLRHNAWDVLSLVALTAHLAETCGGGAGPLQAARAAEYSADWATANAHYERALETASARNERCEILEKLARNEARQGNWEAAAAWWRALIAEPRSRRLVPYIELAKILEHRTKDIPSALDVVEQATALVDRGLVRPGSPGTEASAEALQHRHARLLSRAASAK